MRPTSEQEGQSETESAPLPLHSGGRRVARSSFAIILTGLALWIARDFLAPLAWAVVLAITLWPLYSRLMGETEIEQRPTLAPLLVTVLTGMMIFFPVALATHEIAREGEQIMRWINQLRETGIPVPDWVAQVPIAGTYVEGWWHANLTDPQKIKSWLEWFESGGSADWASVFGSQLVHRIFMLFVALLALFVLLRHGPWLARRVLDTSDRLLGDPGERLASKMADAARGTVTGTVLVAVAEGLFIGAAYIMAGVPNPLLYTLLTMAFAMLPFGAWIAFSSVSVLLVMRGGSGVAAAGIFAWGAAVMLIGDHFVWPTLVGRTARLPFLPALIGIFGGLQTFGLIGLFLGPIVIAAVLTIWREWLLERPSQPRSNRE